MASIEGDKYLRRIVLEGATNFRDLGGYGTQDGRTVRWQRIFRSDTLSGLTPRDIETLCALDVTAACDLRYEEERTLEPSVFLNHERVKVLSLGLRERPNPSFVDDLDAGLSPAQATRRRFIEGYRQYPFLYADAYRTIFQRLMAGDRLIVHCTAGKDRAGTAAAMILTALGVPRATIMEDYLLSNRFWDRAGRIPADLDIETVKVLFSAHEEYLAAAFEGIEDEYGTVERYFSRHLGLDADALDRLRVVCLE